ncbi:MAG TPA: HEAT repeat domain-containing protein [Planctomycetota bacterium]|nr:HEAT repeat domain-containing protein [Planctomycetota bacterium]
MSNDATSKFTAEAMEFPLFAGDPARLTRKLQLADGLLKEYWADFQKTHLADSKMRADMVFLPALLGDEFGFGDDCVAEARKLLKAYYISLGKTDTANDFQFHTWCRCGTVLRRAVFFDWLASRGAWTKDEIEEAADCFLGYGFKHPFAVLTSRCRASNNQALSMALYLAVVGFLFGYKLSNRPTGRFLFDYGFGRLPDLIGLFPADGYGGEGSTYTSHVNTPLAFWTCELLKQLTGRDWFDVPFRPNGTTLRKILEIELRITSPGGLLAPWDHYGWQPVVNAAPFAYLARAARDPRYLSLIPAFNCWSNPGYMAWGADGPVWTLLWWPEEFRDYAGTKPANELFGWFLPRTGAALDDPPRRLRLMQVWDASAGTIAGVGRAQVNPNHLMLDYDGQPVFEDGIQDGEKDPWQYPAEKVFAVLTPEERERYAAYQEQFAAGHGDIRRLVLGLEPGLIGAANAIVVDDQPWYWPGSMRVGKPEFYAKEPAMQVVSADCANFYQPHFDVTLARRTSIWTDAGFGIVVDHLTADSPHLWQWRVHLRPDTAVRGDSALVTLQGGKSVLLAWERGPDVASAIIDGFPRTEEKRCLRLDLAARGNAARFAVVIAPEAGTASIKHLDDNLLEAVIDGKRHLFLVGNSDGKLLKIGRDKTSAAFAWKAPRRGLVEIVEGRVGNVTPDSHDLSDIEVDRDVQYDEFEKLVQWDAADFGGRAAGGSRVSHVDAVLAELLAATPNVEALMPALRGPHWPVQAAAAEVIGKRGIRQAAPVLRELLQAEHALPLEEIYPPLDAPLLAPEGPQSLEDLGKRWRLKTALIIALGRLRDREAIPLLGRMLADDRDFYPVYSTAAQALGRIGGPDATAALEPGLKDSEHNTYVRARYAMAALRQ